MADSYRALCSDFYINQKLSVKLDLPSSRETVLDLFERIRRAYPSMQSFRRYEDELALESTADTPSRWIAIKPANIRSGVVNPDSFDDAYGLHRQVLELAPYFLSISALDIEYIELLFGFDLATSANHDAIVAAALLGDSTLAALFDIEGSTPIDCQPLFGLRLGGPERAVEAHFEVKTRRGSERSRADPISVYLTMRHYDPGVEVEQLPEMLDHLAQRGEELVGSRLVPALLAPIRAAIASAGG